MAPQTPIAMEKGLSNSGDSGDDRSISYVTPDDKDIIVGEGAWVKEPTESDVLCGRGGSINSHPGNERFRLLVEKRKRVYLTARFKREKRLIASSIVSDIRALKPPGRFLSKDSKTGKWRDIGDEKARDKTSQALRENAPTIRAEIETEIKEQRAELQLGDEDHPVPRVGSSSSHNTPAPPPPPPYYSNWGYQGYYYGHPPPPHHHAGYPPPPPPHYEGHHWPPPPPQYPAYGARPGDPYSHHHHQQPPSSSSPPKTMLDETAETVASGVETIKNYFSFGAVAPVASVASNDRDMDNNSRTSANSRPIVYVHESGDKKRRMVQFRVDNSYHQRGGDSSNNSMSHGRMRSRMRPSPHRQGSNSSFLDNTNDQEIEDMEPENIEANVGDVDSNMLTQVASHILNTFGSWDTTSMLCGADNADDRVPFPRGGGNGHDHHHHHDDAAAEQIALDDEMVCVEWEGQEVLLVEDKPTEESYERSPQRMPPPVARRRMEREQSSLGGFSSLGSCHSWLPEQISGAASFFTGSRGGISPAGSMDMTMDHHSMAGTENSLTRVFEHEPLDEPLPASPLMTHRMLHQVPSWERSLRSRSPLSLGSGGDDESLISKTSSKLSDGGIINGSLSKDGGDGMVWERRE